MIATNRKQKDRHGFPRLGWAPATVRTGVEYLCARLIEASSKASTFEAPRRGSHARALPDIPGTSRLTVLCAVLGDPEPGLRQTAGERVVLPRSIIGELPSELVDDDALLAEDAARRREASELVGTGDYPRSDGGATVAPPSGAQDGPCCGHPRRRPPSGLEHLAAKALARVRAGQERLKHPHPARTPAAVARTIGAAVLT